MNYFRRRVPLSYFLGGEVVRGEDGLFVVTHKESFYRGMAAPAFSAQISYDRPRALRPLNVLKLAAATYTTASPLILPGQ